jgi:hypothetical protein
MTKPLIFGAALGGIVVFVWSFVSWTILPWHHPDLMTFTNESEVAAVLARNAHGEGMYVMPGMPPGYATLNAEQKKAADAKMEADMARGPVLYGQVRSGYVPNMGKMMGTAIFFDVLAALLVTMLMMKTGGMTYGGRVSFVVTLGLAVGLIAFVPSWIWFGYTSRWLLTMLADTVVAWFLAGLVIAKVAAPRGAAMAAAKAA